MKPTSSLFESVLPRKEQQPLGPGAWVLRGFVHGCEATLLREIDSIAARSPFRHLVTPGGYRMSVAMTNCGDCGWISDTGGYRYDAIDPLTKQSWPAMPARFHELARDAAAAAGFSDFCPDACLVNRYEPGARLSLHRDYDERDRTAPIVSVSLGVSAVFLWGGLNRSDRTRRIPVDSADVVVWGGSSRFVYHGIAPLAEQFHSLTGATRINLTFRKTR